MLLGGSDCFGGKREEAKIDREISTCILCTEEVEFPTRETKREI